MAIFIGILGLVFVFCFCSALLKWNELRYRRKGLPPGTMGWPVFGETTEFLKQGPNFMKNQRSRYGSFFKSHILGCPTIVSMDPELNRYILMNEAKGFVPGYPQSMLDILGKCNIAAVHGSTHKYMRGTLLSIISPTLIRNQLLPKIDEFMRKHLSHWDNKVINIQDKTKEMAFLSSLKQIAGMESSSISQPFMTEFFKLVIGTLSLPINLPGTNYHNGLKARKSIISILSKILEERRESKDNYEDMLGCLMKGNDDRCKLNDEELIDLIITIMYSALTHFLFLPSTFLTHSLYSSSLSLSLTFSLSLSLSLDFPLFFDYNLQNLSSKMEKKQGFFSSLKEEVVRGLSPSRSRSRSRSVSPARTGSGLFNRKKQHPNYNHNPDSNSSLARSGGLRPLGETLTPLIEGPDSDNGDPKRIGSGLGNWMKDQLSRAPSVSYKRSDLRLLLGVMGAPLAPFHVCSTDPLPHLSIKDTPIETSSAQYILQQYIAASGGQKLQNSIKNAYAMGKVRMVASEFETATRVVKNRNASRCAESGGFVLWQMNPDMWYVELSVGGSKVHAGCNGKLVWRHTPWLGAHTAKGPVRPLRRALQGLDPRTTASMFADARCIGEKNINGEDCFILKHCTDPETLKARSEGPAEIIRHVLFGYFSQKTGLLVHIEDSHLTRIQSNGGDAVYWETTTNSFLDDYKPVEGVMIAHSGHSVVTLFRFGEMAMSHTKTKMEEAWTIEEVAFNVPGLSLDCFIPPADLKTGSVSEACELPQDERGKNSLAVHRTKVVALEKSQDCSIEKMIWKMEI